MGERLLGLYLRGHVAGDPQVPMIFPSSSRSGSLVVETQASARSWNVSRSSFATIGSPVSITRCSSANAATRARS